MDPHDITVIVNTGIGGILLYLYLRQEARLIKLQDELSDVRHEQWAFIVAMFGEDRAQAMARTPSDRPGAGSAVKGA